MTAATPSETMTYREMNMAVFENRPIPHVLFQPRFEPWYVWHEQFDSLPEEIADMTLPEVYEFVDCGQRYVNYGTGQPSPYRQAYADEVRRTEAKTADTWSITYHTPHGDLTEVQHFTVDRTWRTTEFLCKSTDDLDALIWLVGRRRHWLSLENYENGVRYLGDRGEAQFFHVKSPYLAMAQQYMPFDGFIYALADAPEKMSDAFAAIDASYDAWFEQLADSPVRIVNFGENIAEAHLSPRYMEQYLLPWYEKRVGQLQAADIFCHVHIDGFFKTLIRYLPDLPFDGLEALTPKPQGDVTLEEMREAVGDKVLLDGIPAILFLEHHPFVELQKCVERIVEMFPRLILGISDELPQAATAEGLRRVKWVADYCRGRVMSSE